MQPKHYANMHELHPSQHPGTRSRRRIAVQAIADHANHQHLTPKVAAIKPIPSSDYPTPAVRPPYGVLSHQKLQETFGLFMPNWKEQLALCIAPLT